IAQPMAAAMRRLGSLEEFLDITVKTISPGTSDFSPSFLSIISHFGGRMELTVTRLNFSIPASLSAISKDSSISLCVPDPLVKNTFFGTRPCLISHLLQQS